MSKKQKLPLTKEQVDALSEQERISLTLLEKNWERKLVSREGVWVEADKAELTVPKELGYQIASGTVPCPVCKGKYNHRIKTYEVGKDTGLYRTFLVECECRKWAFLSRLLDEELPPRFRKIDLDTLQPHEKLSYLTPEVQAKEIKLLKTQPIQSYFFTGPAGTSKTTFITALYRRALEEHADFLRDPFKHGIKYLWRVDAQNLLEQYQRKAMDNEAPEPDVTRTKLNLIRKKYGLKPIVILEEIDKLKASKFRLDKLFDVIDGVYENEGILIISTNLDEDEFQEAFGAAIYRRVMELCGSLGHRDYFHPETLNYE